jgi:hypothetical protein
MAMVPPTALGHAPAFGLSTTLYGPSSLSMSDTFMADSQISSKGNASMPVAVAANEGAWQAF